MLYDIMDMENKLLKFFLFWKIFFSSNINLRK